MVEEERAILRILVDARQIKYWDLIQQVQKACPQPPHKRLEHRKNILALIARMTHAGTLKPLTINNERHLIL